MANISPGGSMPISFLCGGSGSGSASRSKTLYASDFGITGVGDESSKVQTLFNAVTAGSTIDFEGLTALANTQVVLRNKRKFILKNGAVKALATAPTDIENRVMFLDNCSDFSFQNFDNDANRQERTPREAPIHTLTFRSCSRFTFINSHAINGVCDNLYFDCKTPLDKTSHTQYGVFINCNFENAFRNNFSIIVGHDHRFINCKFNGANGTAPQSGVDLETNSYGGDALIDNIVFDDCEMLDNLGWQFQCTQHDTPRNIRINGGTITGTVATGISAGNFGGVLVSNPDTILDGVTFKEFPATAGDIVRVGASIGAKGKLRNCKFLSNANTTYTAFSHVLSDGIDIDNCTFIDCLGSVAFAGKQNHFRHNSLERCNVVYSFTNAGFVEIYDNTIKNSRAQWAIYPESSNAIIRQNKVYDLEHETPVAYIHAQAAGAIVENNLCQATVEQPTMVGIRFDSLNGKSLVGNECVNLHTTDPYYIANSASLVAHIARNKGGTKLLDTPPLLKSVITPNLPAANSVPKGTAMYLTNIGEMAISDGSGLWFVGGKTTSTLDATYNAITTLPAVNAGQTASTTITVTGATAGREVKLGFDLNLQGTLLWGEVTSANTVTIYRYNPTATNLSSLSGRLKVRCEYLVL